MSDLKHLPAYAAYLLEHRLKDFSARMIRVAEDLKVPLLRFLKELDEQQKLQLAMQGAKELLEYLARNNAEQQIEDSLKRWTENMLPIVGREDVVAEDITLVTYTRKQALTHFIPDFTSEINKAIEIINEIDLFLAASETRSTNAYIQLLQSRISEDNLLLEKINQTVPGALYVFDLEALKTVYANRKLPEIIGYTPEELNEMGDTTEEKLVHPADKERVKTHFQGWQNVQDGEIRNLKYRLKDKSGKYCWVSGYESVFKRNAAGKVIQTIGITIGVDSEEKTAAALRENEYLYKKAEAITHLGSYKWDLKTNGLTWSDELYRIYGLEPSRDSADFEYVSSFNYPEDTPVVRAHYRKAIEDKTPFDFHYRISSKAGTQKILHARGEIISDENGEPMMAVGTVQDVTEKQTLIQKLKQTESIYKQAEQLAHMGNWSWDLKSNEVQWTDNLYLIYGLAPQSERMTRERFLSFVHPDDRERIERGINGMLEKDLVDETFRIISADGQVKTLRSVAHVQRNDNGEPFFVIGTERDTTEKQNLIDQLRRSEQLYKQAQSLARVGNWTWDLQTNVYEWSDEMYNIYEIPLQTRISFETWLTYIHPADRQGTLQHLDECREKKQLYDRILRMVLPTGKTKTIHRKGEWITAESGKVVKMIGTTQDVTEEYRIQQELRESQTYLRKITDATPSVISSYNVNTGQYAFVSEGLERLLGYSTEQVMEKGVNFFMEIIHPDDLPDVQRKSQAAIEEALAANIQQDQVVEFTYRMRHYNGDYRWFHTYGTVFDRDEHGRVLHVLNITLDVTAQADATEKIKEQEHFIQQIADASPTILYLFDVEKQSVVYMNREIFFVLGHLPDEVLGWEDTVTKTLYHPDDYHLLPARRESERNFQQVDSMIQYECRMKSKEGEWRWLLVREIVFKSNEQGDVTQILGAALDINRRKEMEKTILQNSLLLEQSNASLEEFAYVASHDLKEPLRKISTFGDRLVATHADKLAADGKIYLQKIVDASQRMQTMISDLLSISMISNNTSFEKFSLRRILDETIQNLEYKIEQQNARIKADELPEARIIPSQFRQLFQNLLSNSLKFVKEEVQPVIRIKHKYVKAKEVTQFQLAPSGHYHKLEFADNGIGFENEYAGKIFAIFQRLHGRSEYEGSGIGLAICKKIVEHHGGTIFANGEPGEGATFTIILPA